MLHIEHSSVRLHDYQTKIAVGKGWGILSVGCIELAFDLETAGGKNLSIYSLSDPYLKLSGPFLSFQDGISFWDRFS